MSVKQWDRSADDEDGWDNSPEAIATWLAWADSLEPLIFTDAERAAWEADKQARKEWEKSHFDNYAIPAGPPSDQQSCSTV